MASVCYSDQITLHLFQPHQADQMLIPPTMGIHLIQTHVDKFCNAN